jgi:hypothetical protein
MKRRIFLLSLVVLITLAVWRVASGPIRVDFLTPRFEELLSRNQEGWRLSIGETVLAWRGWSKPVDLNLRDVEIHDRNGGQVVRLPVVSVGISLPALLHRKIAVSRLEILRAELWIERDETGRVAVRGETTNQGHDVGEAALALIERLLAPRDPAYPLSFVDVVRVEADRIIWADKERKMEISAAPAIFDARRSDSGVHGEVTLQVDPGKSAATSGPSLEVTIEARRKESPTPADDPAHAPRADFAVSAVARAKRVRAEDLGRYWPAGVAPSARAWVTKNIRSGEVQEAVLQLAFDREDGQARLSSLDGTLDYTSLRVQYSADWPEADAVQGNGTFDRQGLRFAVAGGVVGDLHIGPSTVEISGLDSDQERIRIQVPVSGASNAIADLVSRRNPDLVRLLALDPAAPADQGTANLDIRFPLRQGLSTADVSISAHGHLPGLQTNNPNVDGVVATAVDFEMREGGEASVGLSLNLSAAGMAIPPLGWRKGSGVDGKAELSVDLDDLRPTGARDLKIDAGTLQARGMLRLRDGGRALESLELEEVSFGHTKLSRVTMNDSEDGLRVDLGQGEVDLEPIRSAEDEHRGDEGRGQTSTRNFVLVAPQLSRVSFGKDRYLENVSVHVERVGSGWQRIEVSGETPGKGSGRFKLTLKPTAGGRGDLLISADDAGALFRIVGLTSEVRGGRLNVTGKTASSGWTSLQARVEMWDYAFLRASVLTRLLTLASGRGFGKLTTDDAVAFDYLGGEIGFADGRATTELIRTHGPALGFTVKGWVDVEHRKVELNGAIVPAYTANRVLGKIPVLGSLLSGDGQEGFLAIRYEVRGDPKDPKMEVDTLTSLTPAFLRDMFSKLEETTGR